MIRNRYDIIDVFRIICATFVVIIHTRPFQSYSRVLNLYTAEGLCRIAVPFFFVTTAFLLFSKIENKDNKEEQKHIYRSYCKKTAYLYLIWSVVYLAFLCVKCRVYNEDISGALLKHIRLMFFEASYYHLWYLLSLIYAIPLVYIVYKTCSKSICIAIVSIMWTVQCLHYPYGWLGVFENSWLKYLSLYFDAACNVLFCAVPLMLIGIFCINDCKKHSCKVYGYRTLLSFCLYFVELTLLYLLSPNKTQFAFLLSTPILIYNLFCFLVTFDFCIKSKKKIRLIRSISLDVYCIHVLIIEVFDMFFFAYGIMRSIVAIIGSFIYAYISYWAKNKIRRVE